MSDYSPTSQHVPTFIAGQVVGSGSSCQYDISLLSIEQMNYFIQDANNYENKACVSLNKIFIPFADYDTDGVFPSGNLDTDYNGGSSYSNARGLITTVDNESSSDAIFDGNTGSSSAEKRSIGLNKDVPFIGYATSDSGSNDPQDMSEWKVGPLDVVWKENKKKWVANIKIVDNIFIGYVTTHTIDAPSAIGECTTFEATFGICRNYDTGFALSPATDVFIVAILSSGLPVTNPESGLQTYESGMSYYLPLYIGCGL